MKKKITKLESMAERKKRKLSTITEIANRQGTSRTAVIMAIKNGTLKAFMINGKWHIKEEDFLSYTSRKYKRKFNSKKNGELIFHNKSGLLTLHDVAEILDMTYQRSYYLSKKGIIPVKKINGLLAVDSKDLIGFKTKFKKELSKKRKPKIDTHKKIQTC